MLNPYLYPFFCCTRTRSVHPHFPRWSCLRVWKVWSSACASNKAWRASPCPAAFSTWPCRIPGISGCKMWSCRNVLKRGAKRFSMVFDRVFLGCLVWFHLVPPRISSQVTKITANSPGNLGFWAWVQPGLAEHEVSGEPSQHDLWLLVQSEPGGCAVSK